MPSKNFSKNVFLHIVFFTHHHYPDRIYSDIATTHGDTICEDTSFFCPPLESVPIYSQNYGKEAIVSTKFCSHSRVLHLKWSFIKEFSVQCTNK